MELKWRVLLAVGFGTYMATMDFNIVNVAMPTLSKEFDRSPDTVLWATLASNLVVTGLTLTAGRAGDLYGRKRLYVLGWVIFTTGMATAGFAQNIEQLIAFRFFQAIGVALAIANGNAIVTDAFPDNERGRALGTMGAIVGAGLMSGPIFGGFILNGLSWHWIFWLRVPIGVTAMAAAFIFIHEPKKDPSGQKLDIPGAIALFFALSGALLAVNRGDSWGWTSPVILGLFALSAVAIVTFLRIETRTASPIVSLPLFKIRTFSASLLSLVLNFLGQPLALPNVATGDEASTPSDEESGIFVVGLRSAPGGSNDTSDDDTAQTSTGNGKGNSGVGQGNGGGNGTSNEGNGNGPGEHGNSSGEHGNSANSNAGGKNK